MSFVIQQPRSTANPTDKYRVADAQELTAFMNGATRQYAFLEFDTYDKAVQARDRANTVRT